jgi:glycosyltransferase involved in cell wall biosynthesis
VVAHTGVSEEYFVGSAPRGEELRLLFLGSLSYEKDPTVALDVVIETLKHTAVRLRYVGDGPLRSEVASRVELKGLGNVVEFTGSVDDVTPHLAWADVLLLTSRTEGLPGAILEAGAAGVPSIAFNVGGVAETMSVGVSGLVVPPGDLEAMVAGVNQLADEPQLLEQMGEDARDFVGSHFTLDRAITNYDKILTELLATRANT